MPELVKSITSPRDEQDKAGSSTGGGRRSTGGGKPSPPAAPAPPRKARDQIPLGQPAGLLERQAGDPPDHHPQGTRRRELEQARGLRDAVPRVAQEVERGQHDEQIADPLEIGRAARAELAGEMFAGEAQLPGDPGGAGAARAARGGRPGAAPSRSQVRRWSGSVSRRSRGASASAARRRAETDWRGTRSPTNRPRPPPHPPPPPP